jgi:hypothetical protein
MKSKIQEYNVSSGNSTFFYVITPFVIPEMLTASLIQTGSA